MKNTGLVFNVVLLILVGVLFYLHFSSKKDKKTAKVETVSSKPVAVTDQGFRIGYFEWDSVTNGFELFRAFQKEVNQMEERNERDKAKLRQQYQNKFNSYKKDMSQTESEAAIREMKNLEVSISNELQNMDQKLQNFTMRKQKELKTNIEEFLKEYTKQKSYAFIFAYEPGFILYRDTMYNITSDLVKGLNQKFPKK